MEKIVIPSGNALAAEKSKAIKPVTEPQFAAFTEWSDKFIKANSAERAGLEAEGVVLATERRSALAETIQTNPKRALELAVLHGVRTELPSSIASLLEERISGHGKITTGYASGERGCFSAQEAQLGDRNFEVYAYGRRKSEKSRKNVTMHGIAVDYLLALHEDPVRVLEPGEAAAELARKDARKEKICPNEKLTVLESAGKIVFLCEPEQVEDLNQQLLGEEEDFMLLPQVVSSGARDVLCVRLKFPSDSGFASSDSELTTSINRTGGFFKTNSYGACWFSPVGGGSAIVNLDVGALGEDKASMKAKGKSGFINFVLNHVNHDAYQMVAIAFTDVWGNDWYGYFTGGKSILMNGPPEGFSPNLMAHEFGHSFGLNHAGTWNTTSNPIGATGVNETYGDNYDIMGQQSYKANWNEGREHFSVYNKTTVQNPWITGADYSNLGTGGGGTYRIYATDKINSRDIPNGTRKLGLRIEKQTSMAGSQVNAYWVEFRQAYANNWLLNGCQIRMKWTISDPTYGNSSQQLLDMTPNSILTSALADFTDGALVIGKTFSDTVDRIYITPVAKSATSSSLQWMDVVVNRGNFLGSAPNAEFVANTPTVANPGPVTFTLDVTGNNGIPLAYYWDVSENNGTSWVTDFQSVNSSSFTKTWNTASTTKKKVRCKVSDMKGHTTSVTNTILIQDSAILEPVITQDPASVTVATGANATFNVVAQNAVRYQWQFNSIDVSGKTTSTYVRNGVLLSDSTKPVRVKAYNSEGTFVTSLPAILTVQDSIQIGTMTPDTTKNAGESITFSVTLASGTSPSYRWYRNDQLISGTGSSLLLQNLTPGLAGTYKVVVTNLVSTNFATAVLTVNSTIGLIDPPNQTNNRTSNVVFSVSPTGTPPFFYKWIHNGTYTIPWATGASMTLTNIQMTNEGSYQVVVTNSTATNSADTYLRVLWPVAITNQPVSRTNNIGDNAYFSVGASGTNLNYQWKSNNIVVQNQTNSYLNIPVPNTNCIADYTVVITSPQATNTATSSVATISIPYAAWTRLVQWNFNSAAPDANITTGTTNNSYSATLPTGIYTNYSTLQSAYSTGSPSDTASTGTDNSSLRYTNRWPANTTTSNRTHGVQIRVSTTNYTNIVVTWEQRNNPGASRYTRLLYSTNGLSGSTNLHTVYTNTVADTHVYQSSDLSGKAGVFNNTNLAIRLVTEWQSTAIASGSTKYVGTTAGTEASYLTNESIYYDMVTVWGKPLPVSITGQPQSATAAVGSTTNFTVQAIGYDLKFQWLSNTVAIANQTNATLTLVNIQTNFAANYSVKITNAISAPVTSSVAVLTVQSNAVITVPPVSQTNYSTFNVTFTVGATGTSLKYQWSFNDTIIPGATDSALTLTNIQAVNAGNYSVLVSNLVSWTNSTYAVLTVTPIPMERYWSGSGGIYGGAGTWNTTVTSTNWGFFSNGPFPYVWTNSFTNSAYFGGAAATVTVGAPVTANKLIFETGGYTIGGNSALTFAGTDAGIDNPGVTSNTSTTNKVTVECPLVGPVFVKSGGGRLYFYNTANAIEKWIVKGGAISSEGQSKLFGPAPATLVTDYLTLDGGGMGYSTGGTTTSISTNRGIYLGPNNGQFGLQSSSLTMAIDAPITGPGSLSFSGPTSWPGQIYGAAGTFILSNPNNDYQGATTVEVGTLQLSNAYVLPYTTALTIKDNAKVDLGGFDQEVGNVVVDGSDAQFTNGIIAAATFDLRQSGEISAQLAGGSLTKTTTNNVTLTGFNLYTGDTTLSAGTITLNGYNSGFGNAGTLNLAGGGIILSQTRDLDSALRNPVAMTVNTTIQNGDTDTNTILFLHDGPWTTTGGTLTVRNATSSAGGLFDLVLANSFDFTQPIIIGVAGEQACQLTGFNTNTLTQTFSGVISGPGTFRRSVPADGLSVGGRTVLTAANTYSGGTTVEAGTLVVNNATGSGTGANTVTVTAIGDLVGTGMIAGNVVVNSGTISAGDGLGTLTLQNGLNLSSGGTNVLELAALKDDLTGAVAGTDYDQLVLTGGQLQLGGSSQLMLGFGGIATPIASEAFWRGNHTWKIINLSGGSNPGSTIFASVVNGTYSCGTFTTEADGSGNIILRYTTSISSSLWWSANGSTLGGAGTWDTAAARWGVTNAAPFSSVWNNANINSAMFVGNGATPGNVTNNEAITVNKITVTNSTSAIYIFAGTNTITFSGTGAGAFVQGANNANGTTNSVTFNAKLAGSVVTKTGGGRMNMNNTNNSVGKWVVNEGLINGGSVDILFGTGIPATLVTDFVTLDGGSLGFGAAGAMTVGTNRGIYLGTGGGKIGNNGSGGIITIDGPISGPGDLHFPGVTEFPGQLQGDNCVYIISNTNNNYGGWTRIARPEVRLGNHQVFPATTTLNLTNGAIDGRLNLNGFNQTVAKVILDSTTGTSKIMDTVGGGSLTADQFELRRTASTAGVTAVLAGSGFLTKTTTGNVHLLATNTYTGETTISEGTLTIDAVGTFGSGAGALNLAGGGIILNTNRTMAYALMNPLLVTADSSIQNGNTGTGVIQFPYGGTWGGTVGILSIRNTTSTGAGSFDVVLTNGFSFTNSIVIGLAGDKPCQLTSFNPANANPELTDQGFLGQISGIGSFRRSVSSGLGGRTVFLADNTYSGVTTIDSGTLIVNNPGPGSGTGTNTVTVNTNGILSGSGTIAGNVVVNGGATISAGDVVGLLTLQSGLTLTSAGTNVWDLITPRDDGDGVAGVDFDQLVVTGGQLTLGGTSKLLLRFSGSMASPDVTNQFWRFSHSWTIAKLNGGTNPGNSKFTTLLNPTNGAGYFSTSVSGGNVILNYTSYSTNELFWSADSLSLGGAGTWHTNATGGRFANSADGPYNQAWSNTSGKGAIFESTGGTVTLGTNITVKKITVGVKDYSFGGTNRMTFSGTGAGVDYAYKATGDNYRLDLDCPVSGTLITKTGAGRLHLTSTTNMVSKWSVLDGMISVASVSRFGTNPASVVADYITLNGGGIGFDGTTPTLDTNRGVTLGTNGGKMGVRASNVTLTMDAPFTGPGGISFPSYSSFATRIHGAGGTFILKNINNSYLGETAVSVGTLKLGAAGVLPNASTLNITGSGKVDLNGFNETVASVVLNGSSASIIGTNTLTATNGFDARQSGDVSAKLAGSSALTKTTTNTVTLSASNSYSGGTFVSEGTLLINNTNGSGTGTNVVTVNDPSGILGGIGIIGGNVVVNPGGTISPGTNAVGTLTLTNGLNLTNGGNMTWELGALKDNVDGVFGVDFDKLAITGGQLRFGTDSTLTIQFTGTATAPDSAEPFWQVNHTWKMMVLSGSATNINNQTFSNLVYAVNDAGIFSNYVSGTNLMLTFLAGVLDPQAVVEQPPLQPSVRLLLSGTHGVQITWPAVAGVRYEVQYTSDLNNPNWQVLGEVIAQENSISATDFPPVDQPQRFYRLLAK